MRYPSKSLKFYASSIVSDFIIMYVIYTIVFNVAAFLLQEIINGNSTYVVIYKHSLFLFGEFDLMKN